MNETITPYTIALYLTSSLFFIIDSFFSGIHFFMVHFFIGACEIRLKQVFFICGMVLMSGISSLFGCKRTLIVEKFIIVVQILVGFVESQFCKC